MRNTAGSSTGGWIFGALTMLVLAVPALAQKPAAIDPKAQEFLKQSTAVYEAVHSFSCRITLQRTFVSRTPSASLAFGPLSFTERITLAYQKPNQAALTVVRVTENNAVLKILCDGHHFFGYWPGENKYYDYSIFAPSKAPKATDVLNASDTFFSLVFADPASLTTFDNDSPVKSLTLGPETMLYGVAVRTVTGVTRDGTEYRVTIGVKDHLWYHFVRTDQEEKGPANGGDDITSIHTSETYTDIKLDPELPASMFLLPAGVKKITNTKPK